MVLGAYIAWLLWGTGLYTAQQQRDLRENFAERVETARGDGPRPGRILKGDTYALIQIPKIGVNAAVVEGTDVESLKKGPGHYTDTADPWDDTGKVGIAGHRTTYGAEFWSLNEVSRGDRIRLVTDRGVFHYRVTRLEVVAPTAVEVLESTRRPTLALTTCEPRFSAAQRLIAYARQVQPGGEAAAADDDAPTADDDAPTAGEIQAAKPLLQPEQLVPLAVALLAGSVFLVMVLAGAGWVRKRRSAAAAA